MTSSTAASAHFDEAAPLTAVEQPLRRAAAQHVRDASSLLQVVESPGVSLEERIVAGQLLGMAGDPRTPDVPLLTAVPGGVVRIGLPEERVDDVTQRWAEVGVERDWIEKEAPEHEVMLADYQLGTYPVTNSQWRAWLDAEGWPERPSTWYLGAYPWDRSNHPVAGVSAQAADAYIAWLARRTGIAFRLPIEAEWEHAAKGHEGLEFPWGEEFDAARCNTRETGLHTTTPVGVFPTGRSPYGLSDMAGNVEELVSDDYRPYPGGRLVEDHLHQSFGDYRVARGGSFARWGDLARTRRRHGPFASPLYPCGLRVAAPAPVGQGPLA